MPLTTTPLSDLPRPTKITITYHGGAVNVRIVPQQIDKFLKKNPTLAMTYRPEYGWCSTQPSRKWLSVCVECES